MTITYTKLWTRSGVDQDGILLRQGVLFMNILPIFCDVDDFCLLFEPHWHQRLLQSQAARRNKPSALALSEVMTILILFHCSGYRDLKTFYTQDVQTHLGGAFLVRVRYNRFVEWQREALVPPWSP